jgi:hypothetical protein
MKRYLVPLLLAIAGLLLAGCELPGEARATQPTFAAFTSQQVFDALSGAGLTVTNMQRDMLAERGAPNTFSDRWTFEIPRIAPNGGQIIIFANQTELQTWQDYIEDLRRSDLTRRDVIYVYFHENVMLQVNANLTNAEAASFRDALQAMTR